MANSLATDLLDGPFPELAVKAPVRVATTAPITLFGLQTIDGVTVEYGDRVLVKNQSDARENGIWVASESTWRRASDADGSYDMTNGTRVVVQSGTVNHALTFICNAAVPTVIGTTPLTFIGELEASALVQGLIAADLPKILRPGVQLAQRVYMMGRRAVGDEETGAELFAGSTRAPQGGTAWKHPVTGRRIYVSKQRTFTDASSQYFRLMEYTLGYVGVSRVDPVSFSTTEIGLAHHGIGNYAHTDPDKRWLVCGPSGLVSGIPFNKGVAFVEYHGPTTSQADVTETLLLKASPGYWSSNMKGPFICSNDGKYIVGILEQFAGNDNPYDFANIIVVWNLADVRAAGADASDVLPIANYVAPRPPGTAAAAFQDYECDGKYIYMYAGSTGPTYRHYLQVLDMWTGECVRTISLDSGRGKYTWGQLRAGGALLAGGGEIGLPSNFESECCFKILGEDTIFVGEQEIWQTVGSVVTFAPTPGKNWALGGTATATSRPGDNRAWRETTLAANAGEWGAYVTTYVGQGAKTRVAYNIIEVKVADGAAGEMHVDRLLTVPKSNASIQIPENYFHFGLTPGSNLRFGAYSEMGDYWSEYFRILEGEIKWWDTSITAPTSKSGATDYSGQIRVIYRTTPDGLRSWIELLQGSTGVGLRCYGGNDALTPYRITFGTAGISYEPATGWNLPANSMYRIGATQVVKARIAGWTIDTGTAKRTANATYARTYTAPANFAAAGAAYVQAVQTDAQTRIQNLEAEVAALTAAVTANSQTIKALKDDLHATAGHGLIGA